MAKRTQPKLSRAKALVIDAALRSAAHTAADRLLGRLFLNSHPVKKGDEALWERRAAEAVRDLKDFAALTNTSAEDYLRCEAGRSGAGGHAFFLGQALAMLDEPTGRAA